MKRQKIIVKSEDYKRYLEKYGTNKLDSNMVIYPKGCLPKFLNINEEIFEGRQTEYKLIEDDESKILIKFKSISNAEYILDIIREPNTNIWHIALNFRPDYHKSTDKNESIDVFNRIIWILKDINRDYEYCIGTDDLSRTRIYQYMMGSISSWEKKRTDQYNSGWAIYFKI